MKETHRRSRWAWCGLARLPVFLGGAFAFALGLRLSFRSIGDLWAADAALSRVRFTGRRSLLPQVPPTRSRILRPALSRNTRQSAAAALRTGLGLFTRLDRLNRLGRLGRLGLSARLSGFWLPRLAGLRGLSFSTSRLARLTRLSVPTTRCSL